MISKKLKTIFAISIPVFIVHGLEEYYTGFYNVDYTFTRIFRLFKIMDTSQAGYVFFQILFAFFLIVFLLLIIDERWRLRLMIIPGILYIIELDHILRAVISWGYYPGLITALVFPVIGFLFWKELLKNYKTAKR